VIHDYHLHTYFSCDADASMEAVCRAALAQGIEEIAITDHVDFTPQDPCYMYFQAERYWSALQRCREMFGDLLTIRAGVEVGESHLYLEEVRSLLSAYEYDFVLGSLHWADGRPLFRESFFDGLSLDDGIALYFEELARLAEEGEYDVLAHVDIIRRAVYRRFKKRGLDLRPHEARVRRVLRIVAERGKGLEVNTAYLRKGIGAPGPSVQVLRWFREEGGRIVTLGSDAHRPEEVGLGLDRALAMVREAGFGGVTFFRRRTPVGVVRIG